MGPNIKWQTLIFLSVVFFVTSCGSGGTESPVASSNMPTPTTHPIFGEHDGTSSISGDSFSVSEPEVETPSAPATATSPPIPTSIPKNLSSFSIYDDGLSPNWELKNSRAMTYELEFDTYAYSLENSMLITPTDAYGELYFTVGEDSTRQYPRDEVVGVSFWVYGGEEYIGTSDLAVAVIGSNEQPYWVADDDSVENPGDGDPTFSETRLYYLGINRDIPPDTWIKVDVWLDDLRFDPLYEYVTGFYIKNDEEFMLPFYVDDVRIIMLGEDE